MLCKHWCGHRWPVRWASSSWWGRSAQVSRNKLVPASAQAVSVITRLLYFRPEHRIKWHRLAWWSRIYDNCSLLHWLLQKLYTSLTVNKSVQVSQPEASSRVYTATAAVLSLASWDFAQQPSSVETVIGLLQHLHHMMHSHFSLTYPSKACVVILISEKRGTSASVDRLFLHIWSESFPPCVVTPTCEWCFYVWVSGAVRVFSYRWMLWSNCVFVEQEAIMTPGIFVKAYQTWLSAASFTNVVW